MANENKTNTGTELLVTPPNGTFNATITNRSYNITQDDMVAAVITPIELAITAKITETTKLARELEQQVAEATKALAKIQYDASDTDFETRITGYRDAFVALFEVPFESEITAILDVETKTRNLTGKVFRVEPSRAELKAVTSDPTLPFVHAGLATIKVVLPATADQALAVDTLADLEAQLKITKQEAIDLKKQEQTAIPQLTKTVRARTATHLISSDPSGRDMLAKVLGQNGELGDLLKKLIPSIQNLDAYTGLAGLPAPSPAPAATDTTNS